VWRLKTSSKKKVENEQKRKEKGKKRCDEPNQIQKAYNRE